jgi:hypothetical protein
MAEEKKLASARPTEFEHRRSQSEHQDSGSITFYEKRGLREEETLFPFSLDETLDYFHDGTSEARTHASLLETANHWLREGGEKDFCGVSEEAEKLNKLLGPAEKYRADRAVFQRWWFQIGTKHGFLSPTAVAANFVAASDFVHRLAFGDEALQYAIYQFAQAWHWMQFEAGGEHELAVKSIAGRARGPAARRHKATRGQAIIENLYDAFAANDENERNRKHPKRAAAALIGPVNKELAEHDLDEISEKTLTDKLRPLVKQRFPKER